MDQSAAAAAISCPAGFDWMLQLSLSKVDDLKQLLDQPVSSAGARRGWVGEMLHTAVAALTVRASQPAMHPKGGLETAPAGISKSVCDGVH